MEERAVEVRTWPQRLDVHLLDLDRGLVLAHFPLDDPDFETAAFDPRAPYAARAKDALARLESDQGLLRQHYEVDDKVKLVADERMRDVLRETLAPYGVELEQLELEYLLDDPYWLSRLGADVLYRLLADWVDVAERHYPAGASLAATTDGHWTFRSAPERADHFHHLAAAEQGEDDDEAYRLFLTLVDVDSEHFSFAYLLRWIYYHLTEFPDRFDENELPTALAVLASATAAA